MKVAVVTSCEFSYASLFLKEQFPPQLEVILVLNQPGRRTMLKLLRKVYHIGLLGVLCGLFSRAWYCENYSSVIRISEERNIPSFMISDFKVSAEIEKVLRSCDLGISMGNGYIPRKFFTLFNSGMINIHHEILPDYPGGQSIVWPLIKNSSMTGFTIHFVNSKIDQGEIIVVEKRSIEFMDSLSDTVRHNYRQSLRLSVKRLLRLLLTPVQTWIRTTNDSALNYSTPKFSQWITAYKNHQRLKSYSNNV